MESTEFHDSSGSLVSMLNAQRQNWRLPALHDPQGTPCCHSEWVPPRCRPSRVWLHAVLVVGMLLVARNDQPGAEIHKVLHALLAAWRQFAQSLPTHNCVHCSNGSPRVVNILVFQEHFTKPVMVYMTNQTTKTVSKVLYLGYISIFGALARLLSDHRANFMSNIISKMCKLLNMKKLQTTPYHP